jgi:hypothetical protein
MKKIATFFAAACLIASCEKASEIKQAADNAESFAKAASNMEENMAASEQRREERRKRGDTLAVPYQELQKYLPENIGGYTAQAPDGTTMNSEMGSYSSASRRYTKAGADGSEDYVEVAIVDYNASADMFTGLTSMWGANFSMEDANGYTKTFNPGFKNGIGWEHFDKQNKNSELSYGLGDRFIVTIKSSNQSNNDFVKSVGNSMKLAELAGK